MNSHKRKLSALLLLFSLATFGLAVAPTYAEVPTNTTVENATGKNGNAQPPTEKKTYELSNPLGTSDFRVLAGRAIRIVTGISGSIGLLMFVYGGFTWLTSGGSPEKIKKGKQIFVTAALGLIIIFGSYALLRALFASLANLTDK